MAYPVVRNGRYRLTRLRGFESDPMRMVMDILVVLMLVVILTGVLWHYHSAHSRMLAYEALDLAISQLQEKVLLHGAINQVETTEKGFPIHLSADWFDEGLPRNPLVPARQPAVDVALQGDMSQHPPDPVITDSGQAGFWYNPNCGIVRARIMPEFTEGQTLAFYNRVNATDLVRLPRSPDPTKEATSQTARKVAGSRPLTITQSHDAPGSTAAAGSGPVARLDQDDLPLIPQVGPGRSARPTLKDLPRR